MYQECEILVNVENHPSCPNGNFSNPVRQLVKLRSHKPWV
jgi:hypothetical protein